MVCNENASIFKENEILKYIKYHNPIVLNYDPFPASPIVADLTV